jgi:Zn-finger nucleic acid-binding protein
MQCPHCESSQLAMSSREGVEIDYCPTCRGVWLDRGELDKIIERESTDRREDQKYDRRYEDKGYKPKKKEGFFERFMDFD